MGKAILGWVGFLAVVAFAAHAFTRPPSAAQVAASAAGQRALEVEAVRADNARLACASGVDKACRP